MKNKMENEKVNKTENELKCSHHVKLAFNNDEVISYCDTCGEILDRYVKVNGHVNYYYTYPYISPTCPYYYTYPSSTPVVTCNGTTKTISVGDPYKPEMGSTSDISDLKLR